MKRLLVACLVVASGCIAVTAAPPPLAHLLGQPAISRVRLSPDGKHVLIVSGNAERELTLLDTETGTRRRINFSVSLDLVASGSAWSWDAWWLGPQRIMVATNTVMGGRGTSGVVVLNLDGGNKHELPSVVGDSMAWNAQQIFVPAGATESFYAPTHAYGTEHLPHYVRFETRANTVQRVVSAQPRVTEWLPDFQARTFLGLANAGPTASVLAAGGAEGGWREIADLGEPRAQLRIDLFDAERGLIHGSHRGTGDRWVFGTFDLKSGRWLAPLIQNDRYDVGAAGIPVMFANVNLTQALWSPRTGELLACGVVTDGPRQEAADPRIEEVKALVQASEPKVSTYVLGVDDVERRFLTFSFSPQHPGTYGIIDLPTKKYSAFGWRLPELESATFAPMYPVRAPARDGVELDLYLTTPPGGSTRGLPVVVLVRERLWQRDFWGFQPIVQALATRGFAVLQVNHRGSPGYGAKFLAAGEQQPAAIIPDDIIDATRYLIRQGIADPKRLGILGTSFGGTFALLTMAREPDLFRCGAAIDAVTDFEEVHGAKESSTYRYWSQAHPLVPPDTSAEKLRALSPLASVGRLRSPLLLIHDSEEPRSKIGGPAKLAKTLAATGHRAETDFYRIDRAAQVEREKRLVKTYEQTLAFMERHLTPPAAP